MKVLKQNLGRVVCGISFLTSLTAFGLHSYELKLELQFPDGTTAKDTLVVPCCNWVTKEEGKRSVKVKVEPDQKEGAVRTTVEVAGEGSEKPRRNQFITLLGQERFATITSKDEQTGKTYEVKVAVKENRLNDSEK